MKPTVIGALRKFLPGLMATNPPLSREQRRAIWAIERCRTPAMGGTLYVCPQCGKEHFAYHSCNHRSCPQCGNATRQQWVRRELNKLINAPYFMVTFTLPQELRHCFFSGNQSKVFYDIFFAAASNSLKEKLATAKGFKAVRSGFTAVLHTWNQQLLYHPHLHFLVPGAGLDETGKVVQVKKPNYLIHLPLLQAAFRDEFRSQLKDHHWKVDPVVWDKTNWGIHIQPCGEGRAALKYLGQYVARTAIADSRIVKVTKDSVTFRWKDRAGGGGEKLQTISGIEFVRRYLRHVLPSGLRAIRYYGFCHPAAVKIREKLRSGLGMAPLSSNNKVPAIKEYQCPQCHVALRPTGDLGALWKMNPNRGPPVKPIKLVRTRSC